MRVANWVLACSVGVAAVLSAGRASATVISFDDGSANTSIGGFYAGQGVTFSNAQWLAILGITGTSGLQIGDLSDPVGPPYNPGPTSQIVATFASAVSSVSIVAADIGGDGARLAAFDALVGGNLLATADFFGVGAGVGTFSTLSVSAAGIRRIELYQPLNVMGAGDGLIWDNLTFETQAVPEPTTSALLGLGLLATAARRRRRGV
jgi:PEP-CTERM motif